MNTNFARRVVSGRKARFQDGSIDLDLAYITDQVIIMGFPADGLEALYRNRREDARRFLDERHKDNYWIFNFCPLKENSYPGEYFYNRVSRYPFPDHHAPPLAILPLAAREMREWLAGDEHRVVVLHCKGKHCGLVQTVDTYGATAGKGRSGTLACAYLLTLEQTPTPPRLQRSYAAKEWAERRAEMLIDEVESDEDEVPARPTTSRVEAAPPKGILNAKDMPVSLSPATALDAPTPDSASLAPSPTSSSAPKPNSTKQGSALESVIALHTSRRMQSTSDPNKVKQGVSISSQRRFLGYWSRLIDGAAPPGVWGINKVTNDRLPADSLPNDTQRVRLGTIRVIMRDDASLKQRGMRMINSILDRAVGGGADAKKGKGDIWVSLARYDDSLVELLERWEQRTRSKERGVGYREHGIDADRDEKEGEVALAKIFDDGSWDNRKMVRSFARMGVTDPTDITEQKVNDKDATVKRTHVLHPLKYSKWLKVDKKNVPNSSRLTVPGAYRGSGDDSDAASASSMSTTATGVAAAVKEAKAEQSTNKEEVRQDMEEVEINPGVVLDARREVRAKLYMGQVPMGWMWFIPAFHMADDATETTIRLTRKDLDFPLGAGAWIDGVEIVLTRIDDDFAEPTSTRAGGDPTTKIAEIHPQNIKQGSVELGVLNSTEPPSRLLSPVEGESGTKGKGESGAGGLIHSLSRLVAGEGTASAVHAAQAAD
ncbi:Telomerase protein component 1 [Ceratobasidium sp. 428]|nr:Telomerase protein component 1 [Ceratobasidium sp. 428]